MRPGGVWRLNPDGTPQSKLRRRRKRSRPRDSAPNSMLEFADGKIATGGSVVVSQRTSSTTTTSRSRACCPTATRIVDGLATVDFSMDCCAAGGARALALLEQDCDGKIIAAGSVAYMGSWYGSFVDLVLLRFDEHGRLPGSELRRERGTVLLHTTPGYARKQVRVGRRAAQARGASGRSARGRGFMEKHGRSRFSADGVLDPSFGSERRGGTWARRRRRRRVGQLPCKAMARFIAVAGRTRFDCDLDDPSCARIRQAVVARFDADGGFDRASAPGRSRCRRGLYRNRAGGLASSRPVASSWAATRSRPTALYVRRAPDHRCAQRRPRRRDAHRGMAGLCARRTVRRSRANHNRRLAVTGRGSRRTQNRRRRLADSGGHPSIMGLGRPELASKGATRAPRRARPAARRDDQCGVSNDLRHRRLRRFSRKIRHPSMARWAEPHRGGRSQSP